jgi:hypothetical protein
MRLTIIALLVLGVCGCASVDTMSSVGSLNYLMVELVNRDKATVDLTLIGADLVDHYGDAKAWDTVTEEWFLLTQWTPLEQAKDVMWLQDQPARVRDLAWLIQFRAQWSQQAAARRLGRAMFKDTHP